MAGDGDIESRGARPKGSPVGCLGYVDGSPDRRRGSSQQPLQVTVSHPPEPDGGA
jgi:hypothetical protein